MRSLHRDPPRARGARAARAHSRRKGGGARKVSRAGSRERQIEDRGGTAPASSRQKGDFLQPPHLAVCIESVRRVRPVRASGAAGGPQPPTGGPPTPPHPPAPPRPPGIPPTPLPLHQRATPHPP